ncbi:MAG: hypothetical protein VKI42_00810 [Synechococcaceae cyanobacterium]|nr:hypothetical protein [Synechococcaceae cyanobacterium]
MAERHSLQSTRLLLSCWASQLLLAAVVGLVAPIPVRPLLIERRHCSEQQTAAMLHHYERLVWRDRLGMERFRPVVQYSVLGERRSDQLPPAASLALSSAVGSGDSEEQSSLRDRYPTALVLSCQPPV